MELFSYPAQQLVLGYDELATGADRLAVWVIDLFADSKFYPIFSFLFGLGLAMQMQRYEERDLSFVPLYLRRMLLLFAIGLIHIVLLWIGDILALYAVLGTVALLLFRRRSQRMLLVVSGIVLAGAALFRGALTISAMLAQSTPQGAAAFVRETAASQAGHRVAAEQANLVYATGTYGEIFAQRIQDLGFTSGGIIFLAANASAMLLLGLYAGRRGILQDIGAHKSLLYRVLWWGLGLGIGANLIYLIDDAIAAANEPTWVGALIDALHTIGSPVLALGYIAAMTLLLQERVWRTRLRPLAAVGRMALSNYLLQSLAATTIFYGYGFGLFGQVGPASGLLLALAIFTVQIPLSVWWMGRFRFGPLEWLWRTLTYLRWQPFLLRRDSKRERSARLLSNT